MANQWIRCISTFVSTSSLEKCSCCILLTHSAILPCRVGETDLPYTRNSHTKPHQECWPPLPPHCPRSMCLMLHRPTCSEFQFQMLPDYSPEWLVAIMSYRTVQPLKGIKMSDKLCPTFAFLTFNHPYTTGIYCHIHIYIELTKVHSTQTKPQKYCLQMQEWFTAMPEVCVTNHPFIYHSNFLRGPELYKFLNHEPLTQIHWTYGANVSEHIFIWCQ